MMFSRFPINCPLYAVPNVNVQTKISHFSFHSLQDSESYLKYYTGNNEDNLYLGHCVHTSIFNNK